MIQLSLSNNDKQIIKANYDIFKNKLLNATYKESLDISSSCYIDFGTFGISIWKYSQSQKWWFRKIINDWKSLTFNEFITTFNNEEWEKE